MGTLVLKNGTLVDPAAKIHAPKTLVVEGDRVASVLEPDAAVASDAEVLDCAGKVITPGFVDLHVHFREPGQEYKETTLTGSRAAAAGGYTSVACMANTKPANDNAAVTDYILEKARAANLINVYPIGALTKGLMGETMSEIAELAAAGCVDALGRRTHGDERRGHAPCHGLLGQLRPADQHPRRGHAPVRQRRDARGVRVDGARAWPGKPAASEDVIVARDIALAELTGAHVHFAHLTSAGAVRRIRDARAAGLRVTSEVTPHHLLLTDEAVRTLTIRTRR